MGNQDCLENEIDCNIDSINDKTVDVSKRISSVYDSMKIITIRGWAVDKAAMDTAAAVSVLIDDVEYKAVYGTRRNDVAKHFQTEAYIFSGFEVKIPYKKLGRGRHSLSLKIFFNNRTLKFKTKSILNLYFASSAIIYLLTITDILRYFFNNPGSVANWLKSALKYLFTNGPKLFLKEIVSEINKFMFEPAENPYELWIRKNNPTSRELSKQSKMKFQFIPKISIITPVFNTPHDILKQMIDSVINQTYSNWELCIADGSSEASARDILAAYGRKDSRIKIKYLNQNMGIALNTNEAISISLGEYVAFVDHDDVIPRNALFEVVKAINKNPDTDFIYTDEDKIMDSGKRMDVLFKSDYFHDTFLSINYLSHLTVIRKSIGDQAGWFREGYEGAQDYDLFLRIVEKTDKILHIPKVLYHWRICESSTALSEEVKPYTFESARKALEEHLKRTCKKGVVESGSPAWVYHVKYEINSNPLVSIIIPNCDHKDELKRCVDSILCKTSYSSFEIIIVENGSKDEVTFAYYRELKEKHGIFILAWDKPFNYSAMNNFAVRSARGEMLVFLHNDVQVYSHDWIERMLEHVQRNEIGAVGAKLLFLNNTIQHAGSVIGMGQGHLAGNYYAGYDANETGYFGRLKAIQNISCITDACMMMRKNVFHEIGGFDERFISDYNDVDLCMRIRKKGYLIIWTPHAVLYHLESKPRDYSRTFRTRLQKSEQTLFKQLWKGELIKGDPHYNPNLSLDGNDFVVRI